MWPHVQAPPEITHRTKAPPSLRDKLIYRATNEKEYNSLDDLKADIVGECAWASLPGRARVATGACAPICRSCCCTHRHH